MQIPVRCFSCGSVVSAKWEEYKKRVDGGEDPAKVLDSMGVGRHCCRRMLLSQLDLIDELLVSGNRA